MNAAAAFLTPSLTTKSSTQNSSDASVVELAEWKRKAWTRGRLFWKLDDHQLRVYEKYRAWEEAPHGDSKPGEMRRIFVLDISRRWGKTFLCLLIKIEDCIRRPRSLHTYACAFAKDIAEIILPLFDDISEDCPEDLRAKFQSSHQGRSMGLFFPNGSQLRLVGIDLNPRGLRGRGSDGFCVSEAGHVKKLKRTVSDVVYPQFQRRDHARMILESNAPEEVEHDFDKYFVPDAMQRGAYVFQTIDDNQALPEAEKLEFINAAGGRGSPTCEREYYGKRVRDPERTVIPEYDAERHIVSVEVPKYAHCYIFADPGTRDKYALVFAYYDFSRAKLVVQRSWAKANAGIAEVASQIRLAKKELWGIVDDDIREEGLREPLQYWNGRELKLNPFKSISDSDGRSLFELKESEDIAFQAADKKHARSEAQAGSARRIPEHRLAALRDAFNNDLIEISAEDVTIGDRGALPLQLQKGRWNELRTDFERTPELGHLDAIMALAYGWKAVDRNANPMKPAWVDANRDSIHLPDGVKNPQTHAVVELNKAFGRNSGRRRLGR
jgi:hypothetical protein